MPKIFERAGFPAPKFSGFDLSRFQTLSCQFGQLIPTFLQEVVPKDQFRVTTEILVRLAPMLAPVMHLSDVYMHYYFVPNRIIWNQWENFITGGRDGTAKPAMPTSSFNATLRNSKLRDYLGLPNASTDNTNITVSNLIARAYQRIYLDYYRDPNLVADFDVNTASGSVLWSLRNRAWEKDYFTSALPWLQRGPAIGVPVDFEYKDVSTWYQDNGNPPIAGSPGLYPDGSGGGQMEDTMNNPLRVENLDETMQVSINELRKSSAIQRWLEKNAVGGARYTEYLAAHFGVKSQDSRLQRAEYIGGGKQPLVISEVLNTTGTAEAPQGDMAGHGISTGATNTFTYNVPEHGFIIGIMSILPRTAYQQGIHRHWLRFENLDYYDPEFAHLGEQEIYNYELYLDTAESLDVNRATFGYQQRYAEYKYGVSTVHGDFRTSLDYWTQARIFSSRPALNEAFVTTNPSADEMTRIFAVPSGDTLWCQLFHRVQARRPMPHFADPRLS